MAEIGPKQVDDELRAQEASLPEAEDEVPEAKRPCLQQSSEKQAVKKSGGNFAKRRKVVLLLSYCGKGYMGMQKNPGVLTIEEDLLDAMSKGGAFPPEMKGNLGQLKFQRCARTDKGVSAARQIVSLKHMVFDPDLIPRINDHLPAQIRVFGMMRATKSFDCRHNCSGRSYEYLLPTYAFAPFPLTTLDYRIEDDTVTLVERLLQYYVGTHNFHNFTSGKKFEEASSNRYIISFKCGEKHLARCTSGDKEGKEVEFLPLRVRGQSFVIHQIRKMIGLVIAVVREHVQEEVLQRAFNKEKVDIPRAPALGLLLDNASEVSTHSHSTVHFDGYNTRFASDGSRETLEWSKYEDAIEQFKREHIYQTIIDTEVNELSMMQWLHSLRMHDFTSTATRLKQQAESTTTAPPTVSPVPDAAQPSEASVPQDSAVSNSHSQETRTDSEHTDNINTGGVESVPSTPDVSA